MNDISPLLQENFKLYQHQGLLGRVKGSLVVRLDISPTPMLHWEFTSTEDAFGSSAGIINPVEIVGENLSIPQAIIGRHGHRIDHGVTFWYYEGSSQFVEKGVQPETVSSVKIILPVAKFHERHWKDEIVISSKYAARQVGGPEEEIVGGSTAAKHYKVQLNDNWSLTLWTPQEALDWLLDQGNINTGTLLTAEMHLEFDSPTTTTVLTIDELETKLKYICMLLSFANGGFTDPVMLSCFYKEDNGWQEYTRFYAPLVTPIEQLGCSWLTDKSDLGSYLRCYSSLEKMMGASLWSESLPVILIWYFQSIQPYHNRYMKPWQVAATALGSALERMCATLCEEIPIIKADYLAKENKTGFYLKDHIKAVLAHIGLRHVDGYHDNKLVDDFVDIRNDATHSKQKTSFSRRRRYDIIQSATQWLEEMLLWRLGYYGEHRIHTATGIPSRLTKYSLSKREPAW